MKLAMFYIESNEYGLDDLVQSDGGEIVGMPFQCLYSAYSVTPMIVTMPAL